MDALTLAGRLHRRRRLGGLGFAAVLVLAVAARAEQAGAELRRDSFGDPLPAWALARVGTVRFRHDGAWVQLVRWLPGGKHLVSHGDDGQVRFWDARTGRRLGALRCPAGVVALGVDAKGKLLGLVGKDRKVCLYELDADLTGTKLLRSFRVGRPVGGACFSRDLRRVAVWGGTRTVGLWDTAKGEEVFSLSAHLGAIHTAVFSTDGRWVATGGADERVRLWDAATGRPGPILAVPGGFGRVAFTPDGRHLVTAGRKLRIWDVRGLEEPRSLPLPSRDVLGLSADGKRIVLVCGGATPGPLTLKLVDAGSAKVVGQVKGVPGWTKGLALCPDGARVATAGRRIRVWDLCAGREVHGQPLPHCRLGAMAFCPAGPAVVVADLAGNVTSWKAHTGALTGRCRLPWGTVRPVGLASSGEGKLLAVNLGSLVWVGQLGTGREVRRFRLEPRGRISLAVFSPGGRSLAVAGRCPGRPGASTGSWLVQLRSLDGGQPAWTVRAGARVVGAMCFSPGGRRLAVGLGRALCVYDARTGRELATVKGLGPVRGVAFGRDGRAVAWVGLRGVGLVELGPARSAWFTACFDGTAPEARRCFAVAFDVRAGRVVAADGSSGIVVLDARDGRVLGRFRPGGLWAPLTAVSADGRLAAWARPNGTILIWSVEEACRKGQADG